MISLNKSLKKQSQRQIIRGERGTRKDVIAKAIHQQSDRKDMAFIAINCDALLSDKIIEEVDLPADTPVSNQKKKSIFNIPDEGINLDKMEKILI